VPTLPKEALVSNSAAAEEFVAAQIRGGADYIKIVADVPGPDQETLNALVAAAHGHEKLVVAHAVTTVATSMAQTAGVDFITHAPVDGVMSDQEVSQMLNEKRVSIPTLVMMKGGVTRRQGDYSNCVQNVSALHRQGVPILAGTDANMAKGVPANIEHGISLHEEFELLVECGLSTTEVLRAATCLPAKYFGLSDRGSIEPGRRADLVLVEGNPVEDITATRKIKQVWIAGREINVS
jgi:imidazolonepropionase-like amidohydrolase